MIKVHKSYESAHFMVNVSMYISQVFTDAKEVNPFSAKVFHHAASYQLSQVIYHITSLLFSG